MTESIPEKELLRSEDFKGHPDPHVWFDAELWRYCIDSVVRGASAVDKEHASIYKGRGVALKDEYRQVHRWIKERIRLLPLNKRILITSHDAYNYFGRAYEFQVIGIQGISTASEAGLADIARIVDFIKLKEVASIFVESSVSPSVIERISKDSGVTIGGELFSDAMGARGETYKINDAEILELDTWEGMLKYNVDTILKNL